MFVRKLRGVVLNLLCLANTSVYFDFSFLVFTGLLLGLNQFLCFGCFSAFFTNFRHSLFLLSVRGSRQRDFRALLYDVYLLSKMIRQALFCTRSISSIGSDYITYSIWGASKMVCLANSTHFVLLFCNCWAPKKNKLWFHNIEFIAVILSIIDFLSSKSAIDINMTFFHK